MSENAKNQLLELLKNLGYSEDYADFKTQTIGSSYHCSTVVVSFPDGRTVQGKGESRRKSDADILASQAAIEKLHKDYPDLVVNWTEIDIEAQAGDALIKLGVYLSPSTRNAGEKSQQLQIIEADSHLETVFDRWKSQGDADLAIWGNNLGKKKKATLVEALIWRQFGSLVISKNAPEQLLSLIEVISMA